MVRVDEARETDHPATVNRRHVFIGVPSRRLPGSERGHAAFTQQEVRVGQLVLPIAHRYQSVEVADQHGLGHGFPPGS